MNEIASGDGDLSQRMKVEGNDRVLSRFKISAFNKFVSKIHVTVEQVIFVKRCSSWDGKY